MNILLWYWFLFLSLSLILDRRSRIFGVALPLPPRSPIVTDKCDEKFLLGQTLNKKYQIVKKLQAGGNSIVYLGNYNHQNFAVKCLISDDKSAYLAEITPMIKLNHPNILKVVDTFATGSKYFIVTELCEIDLHDAIFERDDIELDVKRIYLQVLDAVIYLHKNSVYHQDLKPQNILLSSLKQPIIKLSDFGSAKSSNYFNGEVLTTTYYAAPEIFNGIVGSSNSANDVWSLGVILFNLLTEDFPWWEPSFEFYDQIDSFKTRFNFSNSTMKLFKAVFTESKKRPSALKLRSLFLSDNPEYIF